MPLVVKRSNETIHVLGGHNSNASYREYGRIDYNAQGFKLNVKTLLTNTLIPQPGKIFRAPRNQHYMTSEGNNIAMISHMNENNMYSIVEISADGHKIDIRQDFDFNEYNDDDY